ncbi:uncharacterized protein LOC117100422 [Anneissia japonica]|uniref:uncharacterized protein LOC117100422 n=1 Tax=Anneissia japonica TaxID=1529436 RepID=UPI00142550F7|nr:uncharacterized protein LOC117100422 [Anneissia japonica]XP_033095993.1 uncharacterized protein LOC117100422 [Anneissia japonica]
MDNLENENEKRIRASVYDHSRAVLVKPRNGIKKRLRRTKSEFKRTCSDEPNTKTRAKNPRRSILKTCWKDNDQKLKDAQLFIYLPLPYRIICLHNVNLHQPVNETVVKIANLLMIDDRLVNLYALNNFKLERLLSFHDQGVVDQGNIFVKLTEGLKGGADHPEEDIDSQPTIKEKKRDEKFEEAGIMPKKNETGLSNVLSDDIIRSLSSRVGINWYALGSELKIDDDILDGISEKSSIPPAKQCRCMLEYWRGHSQEGISQYDLLLRALEGVTGGEKALDFLKKEMFPAMAVVRNSPPTACQDEIDYRFQGTNAIDSATFGEKHRINITDRAHVGNIATNPIAENFFQGTNIIQLPEPTEEKKARNRKHEVEKISQELGDYIQEALREKYEYGTFMCITPHQWASHRKIDLEQLFTNMVMFQNPRDGNENNAKPITIEEIANPYNVIQPKTRLEGEKTETKYSRRVLVQGELGYGKTSLMKKIAHLWATNPKESPFSKFYVVYLELRQMNTQKSTDFVDHVIHHAFPKDFVEKHCTTVSILRQYIISHDKQFVFLCDGYDELRRDSESQMLDAYIGNSQRKSIIILTTRPDNMDKLTEHCLSHIKIRGYTKEHQQEYITKFFKEEPDKAKLLINKQTLQNFSHVFEMAKTPLFLFYICTLWKIRQTLPLTVVELFRELMVCKVNQSVRKKCGEKYQARKVGRFDEIGDEFRNAMIFTGEAILTALFENRLHVYEDDLNNKKELIRDSVKYGLIKEETSQSELSYQTSFSTIHKSESEFLAAFYIAEAIRNGENMKDEINKMLKSTRMLQVCKFTVALLKDQAHLFLDYFPISKLDCSFLAELLEECPDSEESIVLNSINSRMNEVEGIKINNPIGVSLCKKLSNFTQTRTISLSISFIDFDGEDIVSILQNLPSLKDFIWQGVKDKHMKTFVISPPFSFNLEKIIMFGNVKHPDACRNLARFLYHCKSLKELCLPVIAYGSGLYLFVSLLYGHEQCHQAVPGDSHLKRAKYISMQRISFSLKKTFELEHRVIAYVFLVSRFILLCPFVRQIVISHPDELNFREKLFIELTELCAFREYTEVCRSSIDQSHTIEGILQTPTQNLELMVTVAFSGEYIMEINIDVEEVQSTSEINCQDLKWLSVPFQKIPKSRVADPCTVLHISWHKNLNLNSEPGDVGKFVSCLCKKKGVISLTLPCEALCFGIFSEEINDVYVDKLIFSLSELTTDELSRQNYVTEIGNILPHFATINTIGLPPLHNACTLPSVSNVMLSALGNLRKIIISIPDPDTNMQTCELLTNVIRQIPTCWFNQMDFNSDGTLLFSLPTTRTYDKSVVRQTRDKRQTSVDIVTFGLGVNLYGFKPCHIRYMVNLLKKVDSALELRKVFIHPSIMFTNPFATRLMSAFKQIQMVKFNALAEDVNISNKTNILCRIKGMCIDNLKINGWLEMSRNELIEAVKESQFTKDPIADWISLFPILNEFNSDVRFHVSCFTSKLKSLKTSSSDLESLVKLLKDCSSLCKIVFKKCIGSSLEFQNLLEHCKTHGVVLHTLDSIQFEDLESIDCRLVRRLLDFFPSVSKMIFHNISFIKTDNCTTNILVNALPANVVSSQVSTDRLTDLVFSGKEVNGSTVAELLFSSPHLCNVDVSESIFDESCFIELIDDITKRQTFVHDNLKTLKLGHFRVTDRKSAKVGKLYSQFLLQMPNLTRVDISRFKMGAYFLAQFLDYFNQNENRHLGLKHLDVSGHRLESKVMISFLDFLKRLPELNVLSVAMCRIYSHAGQLFDYMCQREKRLRMLDFSGSHFMFEEQKILFISEILRFATNEQELHLRKSRHNFLGGVARELRTRKIESYLRCLNLSHSRLLDIATIANFVTCLWRLRVLIMRDCQFTGHSLQTFTDCMQTSRNDDIIPELLEFDISSSDFSAPQSGASIVSVMIIFPKLEVLRLNSCKMTDTVVDNILIELKHKTANNLTAKNLRSLVICDNTLSHPLAYAINIGKYLPVSCKVKVSSDSNRTPDKDNKLNPAGLIAFEKLFQRLMLYTIGVDTSENMTDVIDDLIGLDLYQG